MSKVHPSSSCGVITMNPTSSKSNTSTTPGGGPGGGGSGNNAPEDPPTPTNVNVTRRTSGTESLNEDNICRICHDSPSEEKLIKPCLCKGSMGRVHRSCLEHWLGESGKGACEICGQEFNTVRVPKHRGLMSLIAWIRYPMNPADRRNLIFDIACFLILTPLAVLSGWLCLAGAQSYAVEQHKPRNRFRHETSAMRATRDASNSTWTSIGLLSLTGTLVAAYVIWVFVAVRYHIQIWRDWQQRNYIVTIVPLANGEFSFAAQQTSSTTSARGRRRNRDTNNTNNNANPETNGVSSPSDQAFISAEEGAKRNKFTKRGMSPFDHHHSWGRKPSVHSFVEEATESTNTNNNKASASLPCCNLPRVHGQNNNVATPSASCSRIQPLVDQDPSVGTRAEETEEEEGPPSTKVQVQQV